MSQKTAYSDQIEAAKKSLETWPEWMKVSGQFQGSDSKSASSSSAQKEKADSQSQKR